MNETQLRIKLLEEQVKALFSVLSELKGDESPSQYTQYLKALAIEEVLNHIRGYGND